jgi:cytochrome c556
MIHLIAQAPVGWRVRADNSTSASDPDAPGDIKFVARGAGFRATNPRAAVYWNPANTITGDYLLKGTFTLLEPSNHTNYYGLVFGGSQLDGPAQQYVYFLVAQDGSWLVKRRDGNATTDMVLPKTVSTAVKKPDASGRSVNVLEVQVTAGAIEFIVNGTVVNRWADAARAVRTRGIYGIRVNHFLDVQIDGFAASAGSTPNDAEPETVALTATAASMTSRSTFLVTSQSAPNMETIVVAPSLAQPVDANRLVTVFGKSGPKEQGRASIHAAAVLNEKMVDLTKPLPPPATEQELALDALMKRIGPAFASLRQAIDAQKTGTVREHAATLEQAFTEVEAFWAGQAKSDATMWAHTARLQAEAIARDAAAGKQPAGPIDAMGTLGQQCQACHATYREQFANGAFRIKKAR